MLGNDQPINLSLLEIPQVEAKQKGVEMELRDCAFETLLDVKYTSKYEEAFKNADFCMLVGAKPRGPGMERADLLKDNGEIFIETGQSIDQNANINCKTVVVGNPANTNALICMNQFKRISKLNVTAMTRLDHNRALSELRFKLKSLNLNVSPSDFVNFCVWGNHSPTMYPDLTNAKLKNGKKLTEILDKE